MEQVTSKQLDILKKLTDLRNQLSALYSVFNSSIISAEEYRIGTVSCFDKMLDIKDSINQLSNEIYALPKKDRKLKIDGSAGKIRGFKRQANEIDHDYSESYSSYNSALKDCIGVKASLTSDIKKLCDEFKDTVDDSTSIDMKKGYNSQIKLIKKILFAIEELRADYNVKKNNLASQDPSYKNMRASVISLLDSFEKSA